MCTTPNLMDLMDPMDPMPATHHMSPPLTACLPHSPPTQLPHSQPTNSLSLYLSLSLSLSLSLPRLEYSLVCLICAVLYVTTDCRWGVQSTLDDVCNTPKGDDTIFLERLLQVRIRFRAKRG